MAGNVWEWTASLQRSYPYRCDDERENRMLAGQRVLRGGSFRSTHTRYLCCAFRSRSYPARRRDHIGFRVARDE
jgi:toxoflavin biosynthesis protein ToxD